MTLRILPPSRLGLLLVAGCSIACESMLGGPDYRVVEPETPARTLLQRFSSGSEACNTCLSGSSCGEAFTSCAEIPGCVEFASCTLEHPSPASETECIVRLEPSDEARSTAQTLSRCYSLCVSECGGGSDFDCVGAYHYPGTLPRSTIRVTQTLHFLREDQPPEGLEVSVCRPGINCDQPIATTITDADGTYQAEVPIRTAPISEAGFRGYRLVHGQAGRLFPHRLHTSRPLMVSHDEQTGVASERITRAVLPSLGVAIGEFNLVFLQIFDCRGVGAGGVFFEVDSATRIAYLDAARDWSEQGPTVTSQEGAAVALGLTPGQYHVIRAFTADKELAVDRVYVPGDALVMSALFPKEME